MSNSNLIKVNNYNREVYNYLDGECKDKDGNNVVIVQMDDDSGFWVENFDGVEIFIEDIYLDKNKYELFKKMIHLRR
jgi:hypothetical protein